MSHHQRAALSRVAVGLMYSNILAIRLESLRRQRVLMSTNFYIYDSVCDNLALAKIEILCRGQASMAIHSGSYIFMDHRRYYAPTKTKCAVSNNGSVFLRCPNSPDAVSTVVFTTV
jgi:hypothetical protein